jgi:predicted ATP-grasp superfamily ATP-dependent carboligase
VTRVLVTDASYKNALAAIRCLGRHDLEVTAGSDRRLAAGFFSRYTSSRVVYPPASDEEEFVETILRTVERDGIDVVLPIGGETTRMLSKHRSRITPFAAVPVADWSSMEVASDKGKTAELAERLGVPVPETYAGPEDVDRFPVVVKAAQGSGNVHYVNNPSELRATDTRGSIIQQYVAGEGVGFFALFVDGHEQAIFMHRRLREYPVTGGSSTVAESFNDPALSELGLRLLRALRWNGVAMVEFKRDLQSGRYTLMEINPKFWGSLDLAVAAGVEFPWLAVRAALGHEVEPVMSFPSGVRFRWVFDDVLRLLTRPQDARAFIRDFSPTVHDDLDWNDPRPLLVQSGVAVASVVRRIATRQLRRPHGTPSP